MPMPVNPQLPGAAAGDVLVDWGSLQIRRGGQAIKLTPKAASVLRLLLDRRGVTLGRREILDVVWPGSPSGDEVLTTVINELRRSLDDSAKEARYIATIPKLGYRWIGPVLADASAAADAASPVDPIVPPASTTAPDSADSVETLRWRWPWKLLAATAIAAIAYAAWQFGKREASDVTPSTAGFLPAGIKLQPITSEPGLDLDPDLDARGLRVVYTHTEGDRATLRLREVDAIEYVELVADDRGRPSAPVWSPDGTQIAYLWYSDAGCELRVVAISDARTRTLAHDCPVAIATSMDWSADGRFLVYSRYDGDSGTLAERNIAVFAIDVDGSSPRRVSHARRWLSVDGHARVSPDGRRVAFLRDGDGRSRVMLAPLQGTEEEEEVATRFWPYRVEWVDNKTMLISGHGETPTEIWRVDIVTGGAEKLPAETLGPGISVSRDGARVVAEQRRIDDNIWHVDLVDERAEPVQSTRETRSERCPRIAPDGKTLAYLADEKGSLEVTLLDLDSGMRRRISALAPYPALDLRWSPSGRYLAVVVGTEHGKRMALFSAAGERIALSASIAELAVAEVEWSQDEAKLLFIVTAEGRRELRSAPFPALGHSELVVDFSIGWIDAAGLAGDILLTRAGSMQLQRLSADGAVAPIEVDKLIAMPEDQWVVRDGWLAQMRQIGRADAAEIALRNLSLRDAGRSLSIAAPDPPLGRNLDLGSGRLWYARRDLDEADLVLVIAGADAVSR